MLIATVIDVSSPDQKGVRIVSYDSIGAIAQERGVDIEAYKAYWRRHGELDPQRQDVLDELYVEAFRRDLPLGWAHVQDMHARYLGTCEEVRDKLDPSSDVGKQVIRLFGADIARGVIERVLQVRLGFYNCCGPVMGPPDGRDLVDPFTQFDLQSPEMKDC